jgi:hypothetical protein
LALSPVYAAASYVPHQGDYFSYHEVETLGSGTGDYAGYSEQTIVNGTETMNGVGEGGIVSASYSYSWTWSNSSDTTETGSQSGDFTFSSVTFLYVNGTDDQTGYVNPTVWFFMDNSVPEGRTFSILNTQMTVISKNYSYYLPSQSRNVDAIFAQGTSSYPRNDEYGQFTATYTWKAYFDPSTGYIIGYDYAEQDTNSSGSGFTYTENLYVTSTSYSLAAGAASSPSGENSGTTQYVGYIAATVLVIVVIAILIYVFSRRRKTLPKHPSQERYTPSGPPPVPPQNIDLAPKQPPVQQIVIKEVVKVKCRYCGALIDSTAQVCPICGAPRT